MRQVSVVNLFPGSLFEEGEWKTRTRRCSCKDKRWKWSKAMQSTREGFFRKFEFPYGIFQFICILWFLVVLAISLLSEKLTAKLIKRSSLTSKAYLRIWHRLAAHNKAFHKWKNLLWESVGCSFLIMEPLEDGINMKHGSESRGNEGKEIMASIFTQRHRDQQEVKETGPGAHYSMDSWPGLSWSSHWIRFKFKVDDIIFISRPFVFFLARNQRLIIKFAIHLAHKTSYTLRVYSRFFKKHNMEYNSIYFLKSIANKCLVNFVSRVILWAKSG